MKIIVKFEIIEMLSQRETDLFDVKSLCRLSYCEMRMKSNEKMLDVSHQMNVANDQKVILTSCFIFIMEGCNQVLGYRVGRLINFRCVKDV